MNELINVVKNLNEDMNDFKQEIRQEISKKPQITINNIVIKERLHDDFFEALVDKYGKNYTMKLLNTECDAVAIYKKLYPSNRLEDNPIIYHNETFKYLDETNNIISDDAIIDIVARKIQTALLHASNSLICESIKTQKTNQLYDLYDIGEIQSNLTNIDQIKNQLSAYIKVELISSKK